MGAGVVEGVVVGVPAGVGVGVGRSCLTSVGPRTTPPSAVQMSGTQHNSGRKTANEGQGILNKGQRAKTYEKYERIRNKEGRITRDKE